MGNLLNWSRSDAGHRSDDEADHEDGYRRVGGAGGKSHRIRRAKKQQESRRSSSEISEIVYAIDEKARFYEQLSRIAPRSYKLDSVFVQDVGYGIAYLSPAGEVDPSSGETLCYARIDLPLKPTDDGGPLFLCCTRDRVRKCVDTHAIGLRQASSGEYLVLAYFEKAELHPHTNDGLVRYMSLHTHPSTRLKICMQQVWATYPHAYPKGRPQLPPPGEISPLVALPCYRRVLTNTVSTETNMLIKQGLTWLLHAYENDEEERERVSAMHRRQHPCLHEGGDGGGKNDGLFEFRTNIQRCQAIVDAKLKRYSGKNPYENVRIVHASVSVDSLSNSKCATRRQTGEEEEEEEDAMSASRKTVQRGGKSVGDVICVEQEDERVTTNQKPVATPASLATKGNVANQPPNYTPRSGGDSEKRSPAAIAVYAQYSSEEKSSKRTRSGRVAARSRTKPRESYSSYTSTITATATTSSSGDSI